MTESDLTIPFLKNINTTRFEGLLTTYYKKSKLATIIRFDFSYVEWFELFELTQLALWIKELRQLNKKVFYISPKNEMVKSFLSKYEFGRFLVENNIINNLRYVDIRGDVLLSTPYFPIKFHQENTFQDLLEYLADSNNYSRTFAEIIDSAFIQKEQLRNVVIQELGDNMFRHGKGISANMAMAKFGNSKMDAFKRADWRNSLIRNASPFEKLFFEKLNGREFFTIVISDKGPGIFQTLKENYIKNNPDVVVSECDVLEFAFSEYSTSRTIQERLGELAEIYDNFNNESITEDRILPPPTGLYMLLSIVKEFYGILYLRSGSSVITYDFYNDQLGVKSCEMRGFKRLAAFGGTQIKIHFPVNHEVSRAVYLHSKFLFPETTKQTEYQYINIADYFPENTKEVYSAEKSSLFKFFEDINNHKAASNKTLSGIVLDLAELKTISTKALYFVIAKLMNSQEEDYTHVIINVAPHFVSTLKKTFLPQKLFKPRPIILFDLNYKREIIGVNENDELLFAGLFHKTVFKDEADNNFIEKNNHLFVAEDSVSFKHRRQAIFKTALLVIEQKLKNVIADPFNKIYYPNAKVLIASRIFCEGYFEITGLMNIPEFRHLIKQWFTYLIFDRKPSSIVTVGGPCSEIVAEIFDDRKLYGPPYKIQFDEIPYPFQVGFTELYNLGIKNTELDRVLIFCDVVGTCATLQKILTHFSGVNKLEVKAIINATEQSINILDVIGKKYPITAIVTRKIKFFEERPKDWTEEMLLHVEGLTNNLIQKTVQKTAPLWNIDKPNFVLNTITNYNNFVSGHFIHHVTHITYLLDIQRIVEEHGDGISKVILTHFKSHESQEKRPNTGRILFVNGKRGLNEIARAISTATYYSVEVVPEREIYEDESLESLDYSGKTILVIEDAYDTGDNIMRLVDLCVRKKASKIYIYALFKRGSDYSTRKLKRLELFGGSKICFNYLAEIIIPVYKEHNCPVCLRSKKLQSILSRTSENKELDTFNIFIKNEIIQNKALFIGNIPDEYYSFEKYLISYHPLEIYFRTLLSSARTNLIARDQIVDKINRFDYGNNLTDVFVIFKIIIKDNLFEIIDEKVEGEEYEYAFRNGIIRTCLHCVNIMETLLTDDLNSVLALFLHVDEDGFIERFSSLLDSTINSEANFLVVIKYLYLSSKSFSHPQKIVDAFANLNNVPKPLQDFILKIKTIWEGYSNSPLPNLQIIEYIQKLNESHHEVRRHITNLKGSLDAEAFEESPIPQWYYLHDKLRLICVYLKEVGEFDFENKYINSSALSLIDKIKGLMAQGQYVVSAIPENKELLQALVPLIDSINNELYNEKNNLKTTIDICATNIYQIINYNLNQWKKDPQQIDVDESIPEEPSMVFGDKNGIHAIISNIIENIYRHAEATKIFLSIELDQVRQELVTSIYDNGKPLPEQVTYHIGLNKCREYANRFLGSFELVALEENDEFYRKSYTKVARLTLKSIVLNT